MVAPLIISRPRTDAAPVRPPGWDPPEASPVDSEFAHMLAHDLRSPLTAIQMSADALFAGPESAARERYAGLIAEQARAIAWSLEDLVALADCDSWQGAERRRVDLAALADRCITELAGLAAARDVSVMLGPGREEVCAWGVEPALQQAARGCMRALLGAAPTGAQVVASAHWSAQGRADRAATLSICAYRPDADLPGRLDAVALPWQRMPLLAATRIACAHGGALQEAQETDGLGLQLLLPPPPDRE